jgi:hypothetical protein
VNRILTQFKRRGYLDCSGNDGYLVLKSIEALRKSL